MALLTIPVVFFQLLILGSMLLAAKLGKGWFLVATSLWTAFTLFGSIYTMGLMLLQLITIVIAYRMSAKLLSKPKITLD